MFLLCQNKRSYFISYYRTVKYNKLKTIEKFGVDIFSGAGGLSLGAENAGIKISFAVEKDVSAARTFERNHPGVKVLCDDITKIDPKNHSKEKPFIIFGGPPCQGFSLSNTKTRSDENSNNKLFFEFVRFVKELQPKWFLFENVEGITNYNKGNTVLQIKQCFREIGFETSEAVLYASDYGVPQHRNRFFMVGNRLGVNFEFPEKQNKKVTVNEALADLPVLQNGDSFPIAQYTLDLKDVSEYAAKMRKNSTNPNQNFVSRNQDYVIERYKHIKQGQNWKAIPDELMSNYTNKANCHSGIYKRLDENKPSVVIANYRKNMLIHPHQDRGLSVREAARLQSFPDHFVFEGPISHIQQQIGNAVPPLLAEAIFRKILSY